MACCPICLRYSPPDPETGADFDEPCCEACAEKAEELADQDATDQAVYAASLKDARRT